MARSAMKDDRPGFGGDVASGRSGSGRKGSARGGRAAWGLEGEETDLVGLAHLSRAQRTRHVAGEPRPRSGARSKAVMVGFMIGLPRVAHGSRTRDSGSRY